MELEMLPSVSSYFLEQVDIYSLSRKWKELVDKARAKQLQPQELKSVYPFMLNCFCCVPKFCYNVVGTFTLSNLGMFGVDRFDAILPPGTGAIMAVGASEPTVVATKDGRIGMKSQMQGKRKVVKSPIDITFKHFKSANAKTRCQEMQKPDAYF